MSTIKPVDPRLLRHSRPARQWIVLSGVLTAIGSVAVIGMGMIVATIAADMITSPASPSQLWERHASKFTWLIACTVVRIAVAWALERFGKLAAAQVIADLRQRVLSRLAVSDPRTIDVPLWRAITTTGIDGLSSYTSGFLPSLVAMCISTPVALAAVAWLDLGSFVIAIITLPLIPVFMWLVGLLTQGKTEQRLRDVGTLRDQILDLVVGLPTLRAHGTIDAPTHEVKRLSEAHRTSTMGVLRIAFLSGMVLEFFATISVALVAVGIGFRLLDGAMALSAGLAVLIIIPEVYAPVRDVGKQFHNAQDGLIASAAVLDVLHDESSHSAQANQVDEVPEQVLMSGWPGLHVVLTGFTAEGRDGQRPWNLSVHARPGEITVLAGENGSGKSTALLGVLGIATEGISGTATVVQVASEQPAEWRPAGTAPSPRILRDQQLWEHCAYLPQRPVLDSDAVGDTSNLSLGQRQRVALANELADRQRTLLILDEPTAHLDEANARIMMDTLRDRAHAGDTVLIASHDPIAMEAADSVVTVSHLEAQAS